MRNRRKNAKLLRTLALTYRIQLMMIRCQVLGDRAGVGANLIPGSPLRVYVGDGHIVNNVMQSNQTVIGDLGPGLSKSEEALTNCGWGRGQGREGRIMSRHDVLSDLAPTVVSGHTTA